MFMWCSFPCIQEVKVQISIGTLITPTEAFLGYLLYAQGNSRMIPIIRVVVVLVLVPSGRNTPLVVLLDFLSEKSCVLLTFICIVFSCFPQ
jgi:hypothetical protein